MYLDCSTKSKVNLNFSSGLSVPHPGFPQTPCTPVERKRILSILSDLSSPTPCPDPPQSQLSFLTETLNVPYKAGPSSVGCTISLVPPHCQDLEVLPKESKQVSCQVTECSMDETVQTDSITAAPSLQPDLQKY